MNEFVGVREKGGRSDFGRQRADQNGGIKDRRGNECRQPRIGSAKNGCEIDWKPPRCAKVKDDLRQNHKP